MSLNFVLGCSQGTWKWLDFFRPCFLTFARWDQSSMKSKAIFFLTTGQKHLGYATQCPFVHFFLSAHGSRHTILGPPWGPVILFRDFFPSHRWFTHSHALINVQVETWGGPPLAGVQSALLQFSSQYSVLWITASRLSPRTPSSVSIILCLGSLPTMAWGS